MDILKRNQKYKWEFENIGGTSRVRIYKGDDIAHLDQLDKKMWTVLSCPIKGLEIDEKSLAYMDWDADGKIRVNDVINISKWVTSVLKNSNDLLEGKDSIDINQIKTEVPEGAKLYNSAKQILANLNKEGTTISLADTADLAAIFAKTRFNGDGVITELSTDDAQEKAAIAAAIKITGGTLDRSGDPGVNTDQIEAFYKDLAEYDAWLNSIVALPFADKTDAAIDLYNALDAKMKDFFMRSKLASFSPDSTAALDVQTARIEAISAENLQSKQEEIAQYPIARITGKSEIDLSSPINPVWADKFNTLMGIVMSADKTTLTEDDWNEIGAQLAAYTAWKNAKVGASVEPLGVDTIKELLAQNKKEALLALVAQDATLKEDVENIETVDKFLHILKDFYRLLKNFITFHDFYDKSKKVVFLSSTKELATSA